MGIVIAVVLPLVNRKTVMLPLFFVATDGELGLRVSLPERYLYRFSWNADPERDGLTPVRKPRLHVAFWSVCAVGVWFADPWKLSKARDTSGSPAIR